MDLGRMTRKLKRTPHHLNRYTLYSYYGCPQKSPISLVSRRESGVYQKTTYILECKWLTFMLLLLDLNQRPSD